MSVNVGSIHYDLDLETSKFDRASNMVGGQLSGLGSKMGTFAKAGAVAFAVAAGAATVFAVKSAASFEQTRIGLENMLGSADKARGMLSELSKFAAETPFEFPELALSVKQLVAFGFSGEDAVSTMKQLGDVSAAIGAPIGDLSYLMGTLRTQGQAYTRDIVQFAMRGIPIYEYLAKVLGVNENEIKKLVEAGKVGFPEVQKAFTLMTNEGGLFHGSMEKQSKSLIGMFSTLKDNIGFAARELVGMNTAGDIRKGSIFDYLSKGLAKLNATLSKIKWSEVVEKTTKTFKDLWKIVGPVLMPGLKMLMEQWSKLNKELIAFYTKNKDWLLPLLKTLGIIIGVVLVSSIAMLIGGLMVLYGAFRVVVAGTQLMVNIVRTLIGVLQATWNNMIILKNYISQIVSDWIAKFQNFYNQVANIMSGVYWAIRGAIQGVWNWIGGAIGGMINIMYWLRDHANAIGSGIYWGIRNGIQGVWNWISSVAGSIKNTLRRAFDITFRMSPSLVDNVLSGTEKMKRAYTGLLDYTQANAGESKEGLSNTFVPNTGGNTTTTTVSFNGPINLGDKTAVDAFFTRLGRNQELAQKGMATL